MKHNYIQVKFEDYLSYQIEYGFHRKIKLYPKEFLIKYTKKKYLKD